MNAAIEADALSAFEVSDDGTRIRFLGRTAEGRRVSFGLPSECLQQLMMTLPRIARDALRQRYGDNTLRIVYPMGDWSIEASDSSADAFIVTLSTPDGYDVSFALSPTRLKEFGRSMRQTSEQTIAPRVMN